MMNKITSFLTLLVIVMSLGGCGSKISAQQAQAAALKDAGVSQEQVRNLSVEFEDKHELDAHYNVSFDTNDVYYDYDINAKDGSVIGKKTNNGRPQTGDKTPPAIQQNPVPSQPATGGLYKINSHQAQEIAIKDAGLNPGQVQIKRCEIDEENGIIVYDVDFYANGYEYDYNIDPNTGNVLTKSWEPGFD